MVKLGSEVLDTHVELVVLEFGEQQTNQRMLSVKENGKFCSNFQFRDLLGSGSRTQQATGSDKRDMRSKLAPFAYMRSPQSRIGSHPERSKSFEFVI